MWNKEEQGQAPASPQPPVTQSKAARGEQTRIGPSVFLEGTLKCEEDLRLEGELKGTVSVPAHRVVIGSNGQVQANVYARVIEVEGRVVGDLVGVDRVVVSASGNVVGNIKAPRVSLENGAQFKGSIDMEPARSQDAGPRKAAAPQEGATRKGPKPSASATDASSPQAVSGSRAGAARS